MSLAARLAGLIIFALVATVAVNAALWFAEWEPPPRPPFPELASVAMMLEAAPPEERPHLLAALSNAKAQFVLHREPPPPPPGHLGELHFEAMRRHFQEELGGPRRLMLMAPPPDLHIEMALADGSWLGMRAPGWQAPAPPWQRLALRLALAGLVIAAISLWAARRLARPLAEFAAAAERFGRDTDAPPLPESGPRELRQATRAFNRMQERLRRFLDDRTRMLAAMSHDLRTPLTRLRLRAEFVEDAEQQRKMLADLDAMSEMVEATLAFLRQDATRESRVPTDLATLVEDLCEDAAETGQDVACQGIAPATVLCAPLALRRALTNLVDNAVSYGARARIGLAVAGQEAVVAIEDDGPGIPDAAQETVFQPFFRLDGSRNAETGGSGLGLAVARSIIRSHGGEVTLANRADGGLRATVRLPLAEPGAVEVRCGR